MDGHVLLPRAHKALGVQRKPVIKIQSLSRKPVRIKPVKILLPIKLLCRKYNSDGKACQGEIGEIEEIEETICNFEQNGRRQPCFSRAVRFPAFVCCAFSQAFLEKPFYLGGVFLLIAAFDRDGDRFMMLNSQAHDGHQFQW